jgi:hypothetical protein
MANIEEVIRAIECCCVNDAEECYGNCPYSYVKGCVDKVMTDALELLKKQTIGEKDGDKSDTAGH